jgi:purine-binding chemotaxis protein CheW
VVVDVVGRALGLLVDRVSQVTKVPVESVAPVPEEVASTETDYVTGVARRDSRLIILLDLDRVLLNR